MLRRRLSEPKVIVPAVIMYVVYLTDVAIVIYSIIKH